MARTTDSLASTALRVVRHVNGSYVPFLAGSLAYHAFLLLGPLSLLVLVAVSAVGGESTVAFLSEYTQPYLTARGRALFADAIRNSAQYTGIVLLGVAAIAWSLLRIFRGLDVVFARIYGTDTHESVHGQVRDGLVATVAITVGLLAAVVAGGVAALFPWESLTRALNLLLFGAVLGVVFFPLYYVVPNTPVDVRDAVPGTVVAVVGWLLFHLLFQVYTSYAFALEAYGVLGAVLSVLVWLYSSMFILLVGAVTNAVVTGRA